MLQAATIAAPKVHIASIVRFPNHLSSQAGTLYNIALHIEIHCLEASLALAVFSNIAAKLPLDLDY